MHTARQEAGLRFESVVAASCTMPNQTLTISSDTHGACLQSGKANGTFHTMRTTIDTAGRLVIPKELRREAGLRPGTELEIRWREGLIEIEPTPLPVKLKKRGRFLVATPTQSIERLTNESVEQTRRQLTRNRAASS